MFKALNLPFTELNLNKVANTMMSNKVDDLFAKPLDKVENFVFDQKVAEVFEDMIARSVPGYRQILEYIPTLTRALHTSNEPQHFYDLGCSLGAGLLAMSQAVSQHDSLIGVDNSRDMLDKAESNLTNLTSNIHFELIEQDLLNTNISNAAMVMLNFTLQFLPLSERDKLIYNIYRGLNQNGALVISEKIKFEHENAQALLTHVHHQFKKDQGYSELEISQKREAIENVLIPETLDRHFQRLYQVGFSTVTPWFQNLQFVSLLAIK